MAFSFILNRKNHQTDALLLMQSIHVAWIHIYTHGPKKTVWIFQPVIDNVILFILTFLVNVNIRMDSILQKKNLHVEIWVKKGNMTANHNAQWHSRKHKRKRKKKWVKCARVKFCNLPKKKVECIYVKWCINDQISFALWRLAQNWASNINRINVKSTQSTYEIIICKESRKNHRSIHSGVNHKRSKQNSNVW